MFNDEWSPFGSQFQLQGKASMTSWTFKMSATVVLAFVLYLLPPVGIPFSTKAQAASCNSLAKEFKRKGKPRFMRVVNQNRSIANYYYATLRRLKANSAPTTTEMRKAYRVTAKSCSSRKCRSDARRIHNAALKIHAYNRRWARSGCRGTLS